MCSHYHTELTVKCEPTFTHTQLTQVTKLNSVSTKYAFHTVGRYTHTYMYYVNGVEHLHTRIHTLKHELTRGSTHTHMVSGCTRQHLSEVVAKWYKTKKERKTHNAKDNGDKRQIHRALD